MALSSRRGVALRAVVLILSWESFASAIQVDVNNAGMLQMTHWLVRVVLTGDCQRLCKMPVRLQLEVFFLCTKETKAVKFLACCRGLALRTVTTGKIRTLVELMRKANSEQVGRRRPFRWTGQLPSVHRRSSIRQSYCSSAVIPKGRR